MKKEIIISGYGTVAKELIELIFDRSKAIKEKYNLDLVLTGVIGSKGMIYEQDGINIQQLLKYETGSKALFHYAMNNKLKLSEAKFSGDIMIDCTPTNIKNGEPGLSYTKRAITAGMNVVSVSKGALVSAFKDIIDSAIKKGLKIKYSGATAAALPTLDIGEYSLAGCQINRIEGILNGTTNFILTEMAQNNCTYEKALSLAQKKGIAETDPHLDVSGLDSAFKILLLSNSLLGTNYTIDDVNVKGISQVTKQEIEALKKTEQTLKLLASVQQDKENYSLEVKPYVLDKNHPLSTVNGTNKGILFATEEMGEVCVIGGASHPKVAAMAALKDLINIYN